MPHIHITPNMSTTIMMIVIIAMEAPWRSKPRKMNVDKNTATTEMISDLATSSHIVKYCS